MKNFLSVPSQTNIRSQKSHQHISFQTYYISRAEVQLEHHKALPGRYLSSDSQMETSFQNLQPGERATFTA
jgi:hypothetical protein